MYIFLIPLLAVLVIAWFLSPAIGFMLTLVTLIAVLWARGADSKADGAGFCDWDLKKKEK